MPKPPNILFLFTDQQRPDALGLANPLIRTLAIDWIGGGGARFTQACCNADGGEVVWNRKRDPRELEMQMADPG